MIKLQLINADIIDDTDTVTSRLFRKSFNVHVLSENGICFLSPHIEEFWKMAIPIIWCCMQLQWPNSTLRYTIFNIHWHRCLLFTVISIFTL